MGTISTGTGLVSGIDYGSLIDQLMAIEARPANMLEEQIDTNTAVQSVLQALSVSIVSVNLSASQLSGSRSFASRTATSSSTAITATAGAKASVGTYSFTPARLASTHQAVSNGFASEDASIADSDTTLTIKQGGFVNESQQLSELNGGAGVAVGSIRITDASGSTATIDLSSAVTVDDVLNAINESSGVNVTASVNDGALELTDNSGGAGTLTIQNVGSTTTASDLGLTSLSQAGNVYKGTDVAVLASTTDLRQLNDGNGVRTVAGLADFEIQLDGGATTFQVNLDSAESIADVIDQISTATSGRVQASINGTGLQLTDTSAGGSISVVTLNNSLAAEDLGLVGSSGTDTLTGSNIIGGLNTSLLKSLGGGYRGGTDTQVQAGQISIDGTAVDLSAAQTLQDVIDGINSVSGTTNVTASVNGAGNGILLTSSTGSSFAVTDDTGNLASFLKIDGAPTNGQLNSGDLDRQFISESTSLDALNAGDGVPQGKFRIIGADGTQRVIDLTQDDDTTIGEVLKEINAVGSGSFSARINDSGDGILIENLTGSGTIQILEEDNGSTAEALGILGSASDGDAIDGSFELQIEIEAGDSLSDLVDKLSAAGAPVQASLINDGSGLNPVRLNLTSRKQWGGRQAAHRHW